MRCLAWITGRPSSRILELAPASMDHSVADQLALAFETHYDDLIAHVFRRVRCRATAADIVQEAFVRVSTRELPANIDNPRAFLYRVAGNLALDHIRSETTRTKYFAEVPPDHDLPDRTPSPEASVAGREQIERLLVIVDELPERCREVFILRKFHDLDQDEIARRLGIGRNMVNRHLRQALLHCAKRLKE